MKYISSLREKSAPSISFIKRYLAASFFVLGILIGGLVVGSQLRGNGTPEATPEETLAVVSVRRIADFSGVNAPLTLTGEVRSRNEATLRFETPGRITTVLYAPGQFVRAGALIAEVENSTQRASIVQANAGITQARLALQKAQKGTREETLNTLFISKQNTERALSNARESAVQTLRGAYSTAENAVRKQTDQLLSSPTGPQPNFLVPTADGQLTITIQTLRVEIQQILSRQQNARTTLSAQGALLTEIDRAEREFAVLREYTNTIVSALSVAIATGGYSNATISGLRAEALAAQSAVEGASQAIIGAKQSILNAEGGVRSIESQIAEAESGAQVEDLSSLQAGVAQAEAGLSVAQANLERTRIRAPISGTLSSLPITRGQFANQFELGAVITNENALEVVTFISERDRAFVSIGQTVLIENKFEGVVSSIAGGLDIQTRRIEVRIGVPQNTDDLAHGSVVRVTISRNGTDAKQNTESPLFLPLSTIKFQGSKQFVFEVDENATLIAQEVTLGEVRGDTVEITSNIDTSLEIVEDARGLKAGDQISVRNE